jgi:hypothetical protein
LFVEDNPGDAGVVGLARFLALIPLDPVISLSLYYAYYDSRRRRTIE